MGGTKATTLLWILAAAGALAALASFLLPELGREFPGAVQQAKEATGFASGWFASVGGMIPPGVKLVIAVFLVFSAFYMCLGYLLGAYSRIKRF